MPAPTEPHKIIYSMIGVGKIVLPTEGTKA